MVTYGFGFTTESIRESSIEEELDTATVNELKDIINRLNLPIKKSVRKAVLVDSICTILTANPRIVLNHLPAYEIEVIKRLLSGEKVFGSLMVVRELYLTVLLGWVVLKHTFENEDVMELVLLEEAERLVRPFIDDETMSVERRVHQIVFGWGTLCGTLPVEEITTFLHKQKGMENLTVIDVINAVSKFSDEQDFVFEHVFNDGKGTLTYISPWRHIVGRMGTLVYKEEVMDGERVKVNVYNPKEFSINDIIAASTQLFAPVTPNSRERDRLVEIARKNGLTEWNIQELLLDCWIEKQKDKYSLSTGPMLSYFKYEDIATVNLIVGAITDYMNTLPFWRFLGMSSHELMEEERKYMKRPPRLVAGPNMRAMGMDLPEGLQDELDRMCNESSAMSSPINENKKIGRNDPCPCGSGKKYKNCCGR